MKTVEQNKPGPE